LGVPLKLKMVKAKVPAADVDVGCLSVFPLFSPAFFHRMVLSFSLGVAHPLEGEMVSNLPKSHLALLYLISSPPRLVTSGDILFEVHFPLSRACHPLIPALPADISCLNRNDTQVLPISSHFRSTAVG